MQNFMTHFKFYIVESLASYISGFFSSSTTEIYEISEKLFTIKPAEIFLFTNKTITTFYYICLDLDIPKPFSYLSTCRDLLHHSGENFKMGAAE